MIMYLIYCALRILFYPMLRYILPLINKSSKKRLLFELKNNYQQNSFSEADYAFEVSSEGELEQIKTVLEYVLNKGKKVELIYCSDSVEHRCETLLAMYPQDLKIYRLPILSFNPFYKKQNPFKWITAKKFIMCRYDFFPELIFYGAKTNVEFYLLSAAAKNFSTKSFLSKAYLNWCYHKFNKIVAVTNSDTDEFLNKINIDKSIMNTFDFRITNIKKRLDNKDKTLDERFPVFEHFISYLKRKETSASTIFGSYWDHEFMAFKDNIHKSLSIGKVFCLAPHQLSRDSLTKINKDFKSIGIKVYTLTANTSKSEFLILLDSYEKEPGIWIFDVKGVLCEIYSYFSTAYVGGGFGESVHSLLEPYLAGAYVFSGPNVHRSSEYALISEYDDIRIKKVENLSDLLGEIGKQKNCDRSLNVEFENQFVEQLGPVLDWLNLE